MISQTAEYALRAAVFLASRPGESLTAREVAEATHVPLAYLSKVMQSLVRAGLVTSQRGLHGGFLLMRDCATLTVLDIVNAVDPLPRITECPLGIHGHGAHLCPLHRKLDRAVELVEEAFSSTTLRDLVDSADTVRPLDPSVG